MTAVSEYVLGRRDVLRRVIDYDPGESDSPSVPPAALAGVQGAGLHRGVAGALAGRWPAGLAPTPLDDPVVDPEAPLPRADYVVVTWTAAEARALANVLT